MLFEGGTEAADEGVEAAPSLAQRTGARRRRVWLAKEGTHLGVDFGLPELVKVPQELQDVGPAAPGQGQRRPVVPEVLPEGVPVSPLLVFVAAESRSGKAWC